MYGKGPVMPKIIVNQIEIYYEMYGSGEPLLLIHGLGSSLRDWEYQIPVFEKHFQVIACDMRGHGRSDKPPGPYSVSQFSDDISQLMLALGIPSFNVLGISMGGMVAYQLAVNFPQRVERLVAANCAPELLVRSVRERLIVWQRELIVRLIGMRKMGEVLSAQLFIKPEQDELRRIFVERWAENDKHAYLASMRALLGWSVVDKLDRLTMPVLVISADEDYAFIGDKAAYLEKTPNASMVVMDDSRHATPAEHPGKFNRVVLEFLGADSHRDRREA
jgi:3-oxoadipate enol-lactonase